MNYVKSKKGFTLIELLVVIGILAVLAAIAIPVLSGVIYRANASADLTNATEMTNAIERFTSEYELYRQDIASGLLDVDNLDSVQGRVYNVIKRTTLSGIETVEKDSSAMPTTTGKAIYRDTKYPVNAETIKLVIENYTKTSSATFTPQQSDMHFWYSPDCGMVVVASPDSTVTQLNTLIVSGQDSKGNELSDSTRWIDLTEECEITISAFQAEFNDLHDGEEMPEVFVYGDYEYRYNQQRYWGAWETVDIGGWGVSPINRSKTTYGEILSSAFGKPVKSLAHTFYGCSMIMTSPKIPDTIVNMDNTFRSCEYLTAAPVIPYGVENMNDTFYQCKCIPYAPEIPETVNKLNLTFYECYGLTEAPVIPYGITNMDRTFAYCKNLVTAPEIPSSVRRMYCTFQGCTSLTTVPALPDGITYMSNTFIQCTALTTTPALPRTVTDISAVYRMCTGITDMPIIPESVVKMDYAFEGCTSLVNITAIPDGVTSMDNTFCNCTSLTVAPTLPDSVKNLMNTFYNCSSLTTAPVIPSSASDLRNTFYNCTSLSGAIEINSNSMGYSGMLQNCARDVEHAIIITGTSTHKTEIANTAYNSGANVTVN